MKIGLWRIVLLVLFCSIPAFGQEYTGRVTDATGAAIPKAVVTVHNVLKNTDVSTTTTDTGDYTVPFLTPGSYKLSAAAPGFKTAIREGLVLETDQTATVNFALQVGAAAESITVTADAVVDFDKADRGEVVENTRATELPLNGRDPGMLSELIAGVNWSGNIVWQRPFDDTQNNLSVNGGGAGNTALLMDGITNESPRGNGSIGYVPPVDAVQEFKIITNPYDAQYGRAQGGVEDVVLKSGTNALHGDVYEYARRTWLDADTWANDYYRSIGQNATKGQHTQDQYGAELDGPVFIPKFYDGRNKSFFVLQYENWHEVVPNVVTESVPGEGWANGDFSNLQYWTGTALAPMTLYDPLTLHDDGTGTLVRNPFPGNIIPAPQINPTAKAIIGFYPKPNVAPPAGTNPFANNYEVAVPTTDQYRNVLAKWDQVFSDKDRFSLRYGYWERQEIRSNNGFSGPGAEGALPHGERAITFATDWTHTFTPQLVLDVRATTSIRMDLWADGPQGFDNKSIGWSDNEIALLGQGANHLAVNQLNEFTSLGNAGPSSQVHNLLAILPNLAWIKGKHSIHFGADIRLSQNANILASQGPSFWVDRRWTQSDWNAGNWNVWSGNSIASLLTGTYATGGTSLNPTEFVSNHYFAPFVQDDWKITRKLTLNLGVRYDLSTPQTERHDMWQYAFDFTTPNPVDSLVDHSVAPGLGTIKGGTTYAGVNGNPRTPYTLYKAAIQPRIGVAYAINGKTVVRGGFGEMFRNSEPTNGQLGYSASTSYIDSIDGEKTPLQNASNPFPSVVQPTGSSLGLMTGIGNGFGYVNPHYKSPGYFNYSFGFERQFLGADTVEVSYVGSHQYNNDTGYNLNAWPKSSYVACNIYLGGNHNLCDDSSNWVPNPFYHVAPFNGTGYYSNPTIQPGNLLRPLPAFGDINENNLNTGTSTYNSLQVTAVHRLHKGLVLHGTYTWMKQMNTGGWTDQIYGIKWKGMDGNDKPNRVTISGVYMLPVGRGRWLLGSANRLVDTAIGGWELGSLYIYESGVPWGAPGGVDQVGKAAVKRHSIPGGIIVGVAPCVESTDPDTGAHAYRYNNGCTTPDYIQRPAYAQGQNISFSGVRQGSDHQFDVNLSKNFTIREGLHLQTRFEAFNVLNHPLWQQGYDGNQVDVTFGQILKMSGQSNQPRQTQLSAKFVW